MAGDDNKIVKLQTGDVFVTSIPADTLYFLLVANPNPPIYLAVNINAAAGYKDDPTTEQFLPTATAYNLPPLLLFGFAVMFAAAAAAGTEIDLESLDEELNQVILDNDGEVSIEVVIPYSTTVKLSQNNVITSPDNAINDLSKMGLVQLQALGEKFSFEVNSTITFPEPEEEE